MKRWSLQLLASRKRPIMLVGASLLLALLLIIFALYRMENIMPSSSSAANLLAVIKNSGSTNTPETTLVINKDGSGRVDYEKGLWNQKFQHYTDKSFPPDTFDSQHLASLLARIGDVSTIPNHGCPKSVSFGTVTTITYQGKTSGDLECLSRKDQPLFLELKQLVLDTYTKIR